MPAPTSRNAFLDYADIRRTRIKRGAVRTGHTDGFSVRYEKDGAGHRFDTAPPTWTVGVLLELNPQRKAIALVFTPSSRGSEA
jgi:hypothetical protein